MRGIMEDDVEGWGIPAYKISDTSTTLTWSGLG